MSGAKWIIDTNDANIPLMAETLGISPFTAHVLANRGVRSKNAAIKYLSADMRYMHDASQLADIDKAVDILLESIRAAEPIVVYGDYDVDGVTSTVILYKLIARLKGKVSYYIPQREDEGYGLNLDAVDKLAAKGIKLLLTCDNGIAAHAEIAEAKRRGIKVIVLDHHEPSFEADETGARREMIPCADAVIDPKRADCAYPCKTLCAGGLAYKFAAYVHARLGADFTHEKEYLALAAVATFCDVVDLQDENRIIAKRGLAAINKNADGNLGLRALLRAKRLAHKKLSAFDIGFLIGPCINATGRLEHAALSVELLLAVEESQADKIAAILTDLNEARKALTTEAYEATLSALPPAPDKVLVLYNPTVHESIAGIVAGRVKERVCHPTLVLTDSTDGLVKGSARSIEGFHMFEALLACKDLFTRFGGHAMAAGLTMDKDNIAELRARLNAACTLTETDFVPVLHMDAELAPKDATYALAEQLSVLEPFGKANREPLFVSHNLLAAPVEVIGANKTTLRFTFQLENNRSLKGICFGKLDAFADMLRSRFPAETVDAFVSGAPGGLTLRLDVVYGLEINEYNGSASVQLRIVDFRFAEAWAKEG